MMVVGLGLGTRASSASLSVPWTSVVGRRITTTRSTSTFSLTNATITTPRALLQQRISNNYNYNQLRLSNSWIRQQGPGQRRTTPPSRSRRASRSDTTQQDQQQQQPQQPPTSPYGYNYNNNPTYSYYNVPPPSPAANLYIPPDPSKVVSGSVISNASSAGDLLAHSALVVVRQLEMFNVFLGFEQANKYAIMDTLGNHVGYIAEEEGFFGKVILRQMLRTHRPFKATILDRNGNIILKVQRPFQFINSRIFISDRNDEPIGEVHQEWHLWRRKYNLFINKRQFARIDAGFLSWDFDINDKDSLIMGNVSRDFAGFAREIFTDTGQYVLRLDSSMLAPLFGGNTSIIGRDLDLDERAVCLAAAVSIDFDYFSRHSGSGGFFMPFGFWGVFGGGDE